MIDLRLGDCIEVLKILPDNSVDSIVTDPPYGLSFMGKKWDYDVPSTEVWEECMRVLKPGGHLLSFAGSRTYHRMAVRIEDAGFEIRDQIMWIYGSGFPKSHNIGKAIDKFGGNNLLVKEIGIALKKARTDRGLTLKQADELFCNGTTNYNWLEGRKDGQRIPNQELFDKIVEEWTELKELRDKVVSSERELLGVKITNKTVMQKIGDTNVSGEYERTKGNSDWEGWGTALKPAHEPICMARKPLSEKSIAENVLKWGTGGINIDDCRIGEKEYTDEEWKKLYGTSRKDSNVNLGNEIKNIDYDKLPNAPEGRFPANIMFDEEAGKLLGEPSRFFYCPKVSKKERNAGLDDTPDKILNRVNSGGLEHDKKWAPVITKNNHPTVKPIALMEYLIKLITPQGGVVLEPFMGSGSTGIAAKNLGMSFIGIEKEEEYMEIAKQRINNN